MTQQEVYQMMKEVEVPAAYHHFEEGQSPDPPFIVYLYPRSDNFSADGIAYQEISKLDIELYTDRKDPEMESRIETVLKKHELFYEKTENYLDTEKMYEVLYEMEVLING